MTSGSRLISVLTIAMLLIGPLSTDCGAYSSSDLAGFLGYGGDDHAKLTDGAFADVGSDYPDIQMFSAVIKSGASTEGLFGGLGAHKSVDNGISYWAGNEALWRLNVHAKYNTLDFTTAYTRMGFVIHLDQDITVPAHKKIVGHGLSTTYTVSPNDPTRIAVGTSADQFEKFASNNHVDTIAPDIDFDQPFLDPKTGCNEKFWLGPNEDGNIPFNDLGAYGRQLNVPCTLPFLTPTSANGKDWFNDTDFANVLTPLAQRISNAQLYTARQNTVAELEAISKSLPPLVKDLTLSNSVLTPSSPISISFTILENRTPNETYTINAVRADGSVAGIIRDSIPITLTQLPGAELPYKGSVLGLSWNGMLTNGTTLPGGQYQVCVTVTDGDGNPSPGPAEGYPASCVNVLFSSTPPKLIVQDSYGTLLNNPNYTVTTNNQISGTATETDLQVETLNIFQGSNTSLFATVPGLPAAQATFNMALPVSFWYWVQACDVALNCAAPTAFCIDSPSGGFCNPGNVPPPPAAPSGGSQPAPPPIPATLPSPQSIVGQPPCLLFSPNPATSVSGCLPVILAQIPASSYLVAHDPNFMTGPSGSVNPGQLMTYNIEFENTGSGTALGVFIGDVLDPSLDDTTLNLRNMFSLMFSSGGAILTTTPAAFPFTYDSQTRTVTLLAGNAGPLQGGSFILEAKLRSTTAPGTIIRNQALVNFPNALEQLTPTNTIVSAVPLVTQLASVGASSGTYLNTVGLAARLTAGGAPINEQPVSFQIFSTSMTVPTNSRGTATNSVFLSSAAGNYNLGLSYAGDGFYYLPTTVNPVFTINTRSTRLQIPFASARVGDTVHLTLTLTDDQGQALVHQVDEPKIVYLETISNLGTVTPLTSSLLSGTTVSFQFFLPQPLQLSWPLRARFGGDSHYAASISTGVLSLIDDTPPVITILSPSGGQFYNGSSVININFSVVDESDPSPSATALLVPLSTGQPVQVSNGAAIPVSSLAPGAWMLRAIAADWAGNVSQAVTPSFQVTSDVLPPRTSLVVGTPSFSSGTVYATQATSFTLTAVDDLSVIGDGAGVGVAQTFISIDTSVFSVYSGTFSLTGQGLHTIQFFSTDLAGHTEIAHSSSVAVDLIPPVTTLTVSSPSYSGFVSTATLFLLSALDPVVNGVASGVALTQYRINGGALVSSPAVFGLTGPDGVYTVAYQSQDKVGNQEVLRSTTVFLDATPPVTNLLVDGTPALSTAIAVTSTDTLSFAATDSTGSGVAVTLFSLDGAAEQIFSSAFSLTIGTHTVSFQSRDNVGNIEALKSVFASVRSPDTTPPTLTLSPVNGSTVTTATPAITAVYFDTGTGVNTATFRLILDGLDVTTQTAVTASSAAFVPTSALSQGTHTAVASVSDFAGNRASASSNFLVDSIPPQTKLLVDSVTVTASSITATSTDTFSFQATDSGTGVLQTLFSIDHSTPQVYQSTFSLVLGTHTLSFDSVDRAGNQESPKTVFISVITSSNPVFSVSAAISPATLNLKSQGNFVMVVLQSTGAEISANIDTSTIRITAVNDVQLSTAIVPLSLPPLQLGDANGDGILDLQIAFDRGALEAVLPPAQDQVKVTITGRFKDGVPFSSNAFIRTIGSLRTADLTASLSADAAFRLGDVYVFPNPARAGAKPTFHIEAGIADTVEIKVYSVSGRLVMDSELSGAPPIIDSGSGARYAYEYVWDGHIASGVYLYVITAKSGGNKLTKTGKCAVVR